MIPKINYFFEDVRVFKYGLPPKKWLKFCLLKENKSLGVLNFIFCSDVRLQNINKKYLKKSYFTDVISFKTEEPGFLKTQQAEHVSGDVFISVDRVRANAKTYKTIFAKELKRVMIHGTLHLIGFKDASKKDKLTMRAKENTYIQIS